MSLLRNTFLSLALIYSTAQGMTPNQEDLIAQSQDFNELESLFGALNINTDTITISDELKIRIQHAVEFVVTNIIKDEPQTSPADLQNLAEESNRIAQELSCISNKDISEVRDAILKFAVPYAFAQLASKLSNYLSLYGVEAAHKTLSDIERNMPSQTFAQFEAMYRPLIQGIKAAVAKHSAAELLKISKAKQDAKKSTHVAPKTRRKNTLDKKNSFRSRHALAITVPETESNSDTDLANDDIAYA